MNKLIDRIFPTIIIGILVWFIFNLNSCFQKSKNPGETISINGKNYEIMEKTTDTFYKTDTFEIEKKGNVIIHTIEVPVEISSVIDTQSIIRDYYSKVFYRDTFKLNDTLGYFVIQDTIAENRIQSRKLEAFINIPTIQEKIFLREINRNFYIGPSVQLGVNPSVGADLHIKTKKDLLIGIGAGVNLNSNPYARASVSWKINN